MILTNFVLVLACTFLFALQKLLYGPLRPIEIEQLYEKAWFAVTETCLAMTIFRGEVGPWFLVMFFCLLAGKVWGWIGEGRVEILEQQPPRNPWRFLPRLGLSLAVGVAFNTGMLNYIKSQVIAMAKPDMMVMFGFEFAILSITSLSTACRFAISLVELGLLREQKKARGDEMQKERIAAAKRDLEEAETRAGQPAAEQNETALSVEDARTALQRAERPVDENEIEVEGWENKGRWVFYLDLATDFCKLVTYLAFFTILLVFYGLPIHIMRDVFLTTRSFFKRIADFMKYRTATKDMNERYPDATPEEIGQEDVCIICREEMRPYQAPAPGQPPHSPAVERMRPKKLPCGHILHFSCLRSWLERQQVCPTCRRSVVPEQAGGAGATGQAGAQNQNGQHPPADRPGARVFQFGPLRIGVGAARGNNMFEELQQQLAANGRIRPPADGQVDQNAPRQIGFGIGWEPRRHRRRPREHGTVRDQLDTVHQQINQEITTLIQDSREYTMLRAMQTELERLRLLRNTTGAQTAAAPGAAAATAPAPGPSLSRPTQVLHAVPGSQVLPAGSDQLPQGLTLPEGWSMMSLHPTAPATILPPHIHQPVPQAPNGNLGDENTAARIRAMFTMPNLHPAAGNGGINGDHAQQQHQPEAQATASSTTIHTETSSRSNGIHGPSSVTNPPPTSTSTLQDTIPATANGEHAPQPELSTQLQPTPTIPLPTQNNPTSQSLPTWGSDLTTSTPQNLPSWGLEPPAVSIQAPPPSRVVSQSKDQERGNTVNGNGEASSSASTQEPAVNGNTGHEAALAPAAEANTNGNGSGDAPRQPSVEDSIEDPD